MGLSKSFLRLLAREHVGRPFTGPVLTYGRLAVHATYDEVLALLRTEGVAPHPCEGELRTTNIPAWRNSPQANNISDRGFFRLLGGFDSEALDYSQYEGADHIADLNRPAAESLVGRFGLVVDAGTLEHVFDVFRAFQNTARFVRPSGRVVHFSPASNNLEHGFYQFSPTLFYDYYAANGFDDPRAYLIELPVSDSEYSRRWRYWEWNPKRPSHSLVSSNILYFYFSAKRSRPGACDVVPLQGRYAGESSPHRAKPAAPAGRDLRALVPMRLRQALRRWRKRDPQVEPWGLRPMGQL